MLLILKDVTEPELLGMSGAAAARPSAGPPPSLSTIKAWEFCADGCSAKTTVYIFRESETCLFST